MTGRTLLSFLSITVVTEGTDAQPVPNGLLGTVRALDFVSAGTNTTLGPTGEVRFVSEYINLSASYSFLGLYSDGQIGRSKETAESAAFPIQGTPLDGAKSAELAAQLNIISWSDRAEVFGRKIGETRREGTDAQGRPYVETTETWTINDVPARFFIGARGGFCQWSSAISSDDKEDNNRDPLRAADGTQLGGTQAWGYSPAFTNMRVSTFYAGLACAMYSYAGQVCITGWVDFFFSSKTRYDLVRLGNQSYDIEAPGSRSFRVRKNGFRIGADAFAGLISARGEVGVRPGPGGAYFLAGAGLTVPYWWFW